MIYKLRKRFIKISVISLAVGLVIIYASIIGASVIQLNKTVDTLTLAISENNGAMPDFKAQHEQKGGNADMKKPPDGFTPEAKFTTRYFTVRYDSEGECIGVDTKQISSVDETKAKEYAASALSKGKAKGWNGSYRYMIKTEEKGNIAVFVDASVNVNSTKSFLFSTAVVLLVSGAAVMLLICLFSKKAVAPVAESYEKQKQFITDANHELKTPLTLILADLDIAEAQLGKNEWLEDVRDEGEQMTKLVNKLVFLSRMDEDGNKIEMTDFSFSDAVLDVVCEFASAAKAKNKTLTGDIEDNINIKGSEELIRKLLSLLLDNALKYCDENGEITVSAVRQRKTVLTVENTFKNVSDTELNKLFDRFYRSDKARTAGDGYGIGLSTAKAIVEKHGGKISAYKKNDDIIGFKVVL